MTLTRIIDAAVVIVDAHSESGLTMRRLGEHLGVQAMALYRYVKGRDELLDLLADYATHQATSGPPTASRGLTTSAEGRRDELEPEPSTEQPVPLGSDHRVAGTWAAFLRDLAHRIRRLAQQHPSLFVLMATRRVREPGLRPPLGTTSAFTYFMDALTTRGFSDKGALTAYRRFTSFLLGHLLLEVNQPPAPNPYPAPRLQPPAPSSEPDTSARSVAAAPPSPDLEFDEDLEVLVAQVSEFDQDRAESNSVTEYPDVE